MGRFLLIGLDGAEPSLVERWMDAGRLPRLAGLRARGAYLRCRSVTPPATFPAWTTCVTGVNPGRHGIFDFTEMREGAYGLRFVNGTYRRAPALWNTLSDAGKRVCALGVPATYPPERVNGVMVSGFDSPVCTRVHASFVEPRSEYAGVRDWRFADFQESRIGPGWHEKALPRLLDGIAAKERIAARLLAREPWDFFMAVFGESDTVAHHFWMFHDPGSPRHRPGREDAIRVVYERLDAAVGVLIDAAPDMTVGVVSDHGFGGAGDGVAHLNNWLAERGYLRFADDARGSLLKRWALSLTPAAWQGALFRRFQHLAERAEARSRFGGIDWSGTTAWSEELGYFPSVRVNLRGREPMGRVDPSEYVAFCERLCAELREWEPVRDAVPRGRVYTGDHVANAPDILIEPAVENGYAYAFLRARGGPALRRLRPDEYLGGKERGMNGTHRGTGVLFLSQPTAAESARLEDVAPTVLAEVGVPGPPMEGRSLLGASLTPEPPARPPDPRRPYAPADEAAVEQRLRDLGYLE